MCFDLHMVLSCWSRSHESVFSIRGSLISITAPDDDNITFDVIKRDDSATTSHLTVPPTISALKRFVVLSLFLCELSGRVLSLKHLMMSP
jgi:hypothetical protein